ncbi:superfamily II DNA or RNA helicase [Streptomyces sp. 1114.5]|uniref:helicase-related protein n=1 Tax=Streptomyces sp. 1114.5 TaxID=1938830 RepID=UPI000F141301|nr:helicase-related protein [Streptomyces sp. 1114.5]RKT11418.1 superfamily II DNA or RNA helicase [Streptomyces sp. 1114.5]
MPVSRPHENDVVAVVEDLSRRVLDVYRVDPGHVREHANNERRITQGGYGERQLYELVQNGADENLEWETGADTKIHVLLTETHLYCANTGTPMTPDGADTILRMAVSRKRTGKIGRFGVGVKSVLSVSDTPRFYSSTGSFGFDKQWSAQKIRDTVPELTDFDPTPVLRMAQPLDLEADRSSDRYLDGLMQWASTVVMLPLNEGAHERLGRDIVNFPAHFMLFSAHLDRLVLEDSRPGHELRRELTQAVDRGEHRLVERCNDDPRPGERWSVFSWDHRPSEEAAAAAGELHDRPVVTISWAVPAKGHPLRLKRGNFWAYFPTHYDTTLTGILNAPWRTPEDRQNLTKSIFNEELVRKAAELVVTSIPELIEPTDPGSYLSLLTARGREASQWGDALLSDRVLATAARLPSLPDQEGMLRLPRELKLHPEGLDPEWLRMWADHPGRPRNWCHHSVENRERRSRARDILVEAGGAVASLREWLEALVEDRSVDGAKRALAIAAAVTEGGNAAQATDARAAEILLTERGDFRSAADGTVYRRHGGTRLPYESTVYLHPSIAEDPDLLEALGHLGIQEANAAGRLRAAAITGFTRYRNGDWEEFWQLVRTVDAGSAAEILREILPDPLRLLKVRTASGVFRPVHQTLLAGPVVPADGQRDRTLLVDPVFHTGDVELLRALGAVDRPMANTAPHAAECYGEYSKVMYHQYCASLPADSTRPRSGSVSLMGTYPPGPIDLLRDLSREGKAAFARELPPEGNTADWSCARTNGTGRRLSVDSPLIWMLRQEGWLATTLSHRRPGDCVSPELDVDGAFLPKADLPVRYARALGLPARLTDVPPALWNELVERIDAATDALFVGAAYTFLLRSAPAGIVDSVTHAFRCGAGDETATSSDIAVTADRGQYDVLVRERVPALLVPTDEDAAFLIDRHRFRLPSDLLVEEIHAVLSETPVPLTDLFPRLRQVLPRGTAWKLAHCSDLIKIVRGRPEGRREEPLSEALDGYTVLLAEEQDEEATLQAVDRLVGLRLGAEGCRDLLRQQAKDREGERFLRVRQEDDQARKLLLALGERRLLDELPPGLALADAEIGGVPMDGLRAAQLLIEAHGEDVLRVLSSALTEAGFQVPHSWTGGATAQRFVSSYGFPEAWAGDPETPASPAPYETVPGPRRPLALHDYQAALVERMYAHLAQHEEKRAMLQVPTGSGKTRIAAEAGVRAIRDGLLKGPVLWIAQSQELAEQAIETWAYVWQTEGSSQPLRITRMWGGLPAAVPVADGPQVVVAIDDTAVTRLPQENYAWLRDCSLVVVDEAHFAVPRTYTRIFDALGIDQRRTSRHLVGLTATAFRGDNEEETKTLASRFGHKRLDQGVFEDDDAYTHLQSIRVLAKVEHEELLGASCVLDESQVREMERTHAMALPAEVVRRLAQDVERTRRIVDRIGRLPVDWPVLVFATSVEHAQVLAALLQDRGITAASIDGQTPPSTRRRRIAAFRDGRIRVLTNFKVLTQGFDAPAVRAVVVARPTFSPNTYIQMIGRGLRGELNGGKDSCLILNVADNIENFGRGLAYTRMEHLWHKA